MALAGHNKGQKRCKLPHGVFCFMPASTVKNGKYEPPDSTPCLECKRPIGTDRIWIFSEMKRGWGYMCVNCILDNAMLRGAGTEHFINQRGLIRIPWSNLLWRYLWILNVLMKNVVKNFSLTVL